MVKVKTYSERLTIQRGMLYGKKDGEKGLEYFGPTKDIKINFATESVDHESLEQSIKVQDYSAIIKSTVTGNFTAEAPTVRNIQRFFLGSVNKIEQEAGSIEHQELDFDNVEDRWFEIGKRDLSNISISKDDLEAENILSLATNTGNAIVNTPTKFSGLIPSIYTIEYLADYFTMLNPLNEEIENEYDENTLQGQSNELNFSISSGVAKEQDTFSTTISWGLENGFVASDTNTGTGVLSLPTFGGSVTNHEYKITYHSEKNTLTLPSTQTEQVQVLNNDYTSTLFTFSSSGDLENNDSFIIELTASTTGAEYAGTNDTPKELTVQLLNSIQKGEYTVEYSDVLIIKNPAGTVLQYIQDETNPLKYTVNNVVILEFSEEGAFVNDDAWMFDVVFEATVTADENNTSTAILENFIFNNNVVQGQYNFQFVAEHLTLIDTEELDIEINLFHETEGLEGVYESETIGFTLTGSPADNDFFTATPQKQATAFIASGTNTGNAILNMPVLKENVKIGIYQLIFHAREWTLKDENEAEIPLQKQENIFTSGKLGFTWAGGIPHNHDKFTCNVKHVYTVIPKENNYEVNERSGLFQPFKDSVFFQDNFYTHYNQPAKFYISMDVAPLTIQKVGAATSLDYMYMHIVFKSDPATGVRGDFEGYAMIKPNGDLSFKGDEFQSMTFDLTFNRHPDYDSPVGFVYNDLGVKLGVGGVK